jgi:hypothetical protein
VCRIRRERRKPPDRAADLIGRLTGALIELTVDSAGLVWGLR